MKIFLFFYDIYNVKPIYAGSVFLCKERSELVPEKKKGRLLAIYSCGHFLVDLSCAFLMFSVPTSGTERLISLILYNFFAFAVQMPMGLVADKLNRNGAVASAGLIITLLAFILAPVPIICSVVLGLGNCLYHVGGGIEVLGFGDKKQWMLGVFVSPGAIGLFIGTMIANNKLWSIALGGVILFVLSAAVVLWLNYTYSLKAPSGNTELSVQTSGRAPIISFICLFLVVILRSYVGITLYTPWKNGILLSVLSVLGLAFGKAAGGLLADKFGAIRTAIVSLALSSVLFIFSENAVFGILAIFLFNMTMPLTLFAMAKMFSGAKGFAFGCLTFALFLGCLPNFLSIPIPFYGEVWFHAIESVMSLVLLAVGLLACSEREERDE